MSDSESAFAVADVELPADAEDAAEAGYRRSATARVKQALGQAKQAAYERDQAQARARELETLLAQTSASSAAHRATSDYEDAKAALKAARFDGDAEAETAALSRLTSAQIATHEAERAKAYADAQARQAPPAAPQLSAAMQEWMSDNPWFSSDRAMNLAALGFHEEAVKKGMKPETPDYFDHIGKRMRKAFPDEFDDDGAEVHVPPTGAPPAAPRRNTPAPASSTRTVRLSPEQREAAKISGVSEQAYAAALLRAQRREG